MLIVFPLFFVKIIGTKYNMDLDVTIDQLKHFYKEVSEAFEATQKKSTLLCPSGCGHCCLAPSVEASPIEMLPMAQKLLELGLAESILEKIQQEAPQSCVIYEQHSEKKGRCTQYENRPTLCRQFAVSGYFKKDRSIDLSLCKELKEIYPHYKELDLEALDPEIISEWTYQLLAIHSEVLKTRQPISNALGIALEKLLFRKALSGAN
jgi:uncharacterized protein